MAVEIIEGQGAVLGVNLGHLIVTSGILCMRGSDTLFPNDLGGLVFCVSGKVL